MQKIALKEIFMPITFLSDQDVYGLIIEGCRQKRIALNMTQSDLASRTGLSLRTIKGFETGQSINLMSLIRILRALGEFSRLEKLVPEPQISAKSIYLNEPVAKKKRVRRVSS